MPFTSTTPTTFNNPNFAYTQAGNPSFVPSRSMSYSQVEGIPQQFNNYPNVQYGHPEPQAGYTLPSQPHFSHNSFVQHGSGNMSPQSIGPEAVPRTWSSAPSVQAPMVASQHYPQNRPSAFYPHQQPGNVYDGRAHPGYAQHGQYYTPSSHPG
jgi:hypothetical protein